MTSTAVVRGELGFPIEPNLHFEGDMSISHYAAEARDRGCIDAESHVLPAIGSAAHCWFARILCFCCSNSASVNMPRLCKSSSFVSSV